MPLLLIAKLSKIDVTVGLKNPPPPTIEGSACHPNLRNTPLTSHRRHNGYTECHGEGTEYSRTLGTVKAPKRFERKKFRPRPFPYVETAAKVRGMGREAAAKTNKRFAKPRKKISRVETIGLEPTTLALQTRFLGELNAAN